MGFGRSYRFVATLRFGIKQPTYFSLFQSRPDPPHPSHPFALRANVYLAYAIPDLPVAVSPSCDSEFVGGVNI